MLLLRMLDTIYNIKQYFFRKMIQTGPGLCPCSKSTVAFFSEEDSLGLPPSPRRFSPIPVKRRNHLYIPTRATFLNFWSAVWSVGLFSVRTRANYCHPSLLLPTNITQYILSVPPLEKLSSSAPSLTRSPFLTFFFFDLH